MGSNGKMPGYNHPNAPVVSALTYSFVSIAITLFNKAVLSSYGFDSSMTLTLLQGAVTMIALAGMKARGWIDYPDFSWDLAWKVAPLSFVFISYVVVSLVSLGRVNVPMFTALRRLTILFVMVEEYVLLGVIPTFGVLKTVVVMTLGAGIAAWKDLTFDPVSYFYLFLTNLFTSLYTVYINKVKKDTGLNIFAMMFYNNATTMPFLAVIAWWTGDLGKAAAFTGYGDLGFQISFQASIFLAFILNLSTFYCTSLNSARTQTVVGQLKNFVAFLLGLVLFSDYIFEPVNFFGLLVGFAGSVWYTYVTYADKLAKSAATKPPGEDGAKAGALPDVTSPPPTSAGNPSGSLADRAADEEAGGSGSAAGGLRDRR